MSSAQIWILLSVGSILLIGFVALIEHAFSILFFYILFFSAGLTLVVSFADKRQQRFFCSLFFYGYLTKAFIAVLFYYYFIRVTGMPFEGGAFKDSYFFHSSAVIIANDWLGGNIARFPGGPSGYHWINGIVYFVGEIIGGANPLNTRFLNCLVSSLIPVYVYKIAVLIYDQKTARIASMIALCYPTFILYASLQLRDIYITLIVLHIGYLSTLLVFRPKNYTLISIFALILLLMYFRPAYSFAVSLCVILGLAINFLSSRRKSRILIGICVVFAVFVSIFPSIRNRDFFHILMGKKEGISLQYNLVRYLKDNITANYEKAQYRADESGSLGAQMLGSALKSKAHLITVLPALQLVAPYPPWKDIISPRTTLTVSQNIAAIGWHLILPLFLLGLWYCWRIKRMESFFLYSITLVIILLVAITNVGNIRLRMPIIPFAIIFAAVGLKVYRNKIWFPVFYIGFHFSLFFAYHFLKYRSAFPISLLLVWGLVAISLVLFSLKKGKLFNRFY